MTRPTELSQADTLITLFTVDALLLTAMSVILTFTDTPGRVPDLPISLQKLGWCAFGIVCLLAAGTFTAWFAIFSTPWPSHTEREIEAAAIALGIVSQPLVAWVLARSLNNKK